MRVGIKSVEEREGLRVGEREGVTEGEMECASRERRGVRMGKERVGEWGRRERENVSEWEVIVEREGVA